MSSYFTDLAQQYIDGEWRPGTGSWDIIDFNPYDDEKLASITIATADEVDQAYRAAARAQQEWAATNPYARRAVFEKALRLVEEREQEITEVIIAELGGTRLKAAFELHLAKEFLREAVHLALRPEGRIIPSPVDGKENRVYRVPVGVVGVISPFNFPFLLSIKSVAPALALGNGVVLKPHQNTPVTGGSLVAKIFEDAGLPGGLLNVVITDIARSATPSSSTRCPRSSPSPAPTRSAGTSPPSAPPTSSARSSNSAATAPRGPRRRRPRLRGRRGRLQPVRPPGPGLHGREPRPGRPLGRGRVHREVRGQGEVAQGRRPARPGDGHRPGDQLHPGERRFARGGAGPRRGRHRPGARHRHRQPGRAVRPHGLPADSALLRQEVFGPVCFLIPFDGEEEAVRIVNDTPYGLSGAVHTADIERGVAFAKRIDTGMFHVNDGTVHDEPIVPFGGEKHSGIGRLNGDTMLDAFTTVKWISVQHGRSGFPF